MPDIAKIPGIVLNDSEPVFNEPWEAQAFAMVIRLHEQNVFGWDEWAETLGSVIREDDGSTPYYELWYKALETITSKKSLISMREIETRKSEWQAALKATPHGEPVVLDHAQSTCR